MRALVFLVIRLLHRTPVMRWLRSARAWRDQRFDPQVRQLRRTVRLLRRGQVEVLFIADSSATFYSPDDVDQTRLPQMLQRELGPDLKVHLVAGAGYHPEIHAELVRILGTLKQRPRVVVQSTAIRTAGGALHITEHPEYGYQRSIARLRKVKHARRLGSAWDPALRRSPEELDAFHAIEVDTRWQQARTIGEFRGKLVGRRGSEEVLERQQMLFDYFHGDTYLPEDPGPRHFRLLAQRLREYGVPVVQYWPPIPVEMGEKYFPGEFEEHTRGNWERLQPIWDAELGDLNQLAADPFITPAEEFIDRYDGTEHWNQAGRERLAKLLTQSIRDAIG